MLSLNQFRRVQQLLSSQCQCYVIGAMKQLKLSSLRYNAVVMEISEAYARAGTSTPPETFLALSGSLTESQLDMFWEYLKLALDTEIMGQSQTSFRDLDALKASYQKAINTHMQTSEAMGLTVLNLPEFDALTAAYALKV